MGSTDLSSAAYTILNVEIALGVPAVWSAVNFISGTLALLPLEIQRRTESGHEMVCDGFWAWLDRAVNPTFLIIAWTKYVFGYVLTGVRTVTLILRIGW